MKQIHTHPTLRQASSEQPKQEPRPDIVPVDEFPANVPVYAQTEHAAERRSKTVIKYADCSVLEAVQAKCTNIVDKFDHKAILYIGSEEYDYSTITILEGLQNLGFTVYTLKKPNINSWFCNEVIESTAGLKVDFVLFNLGWGTRWSYYNRYQLRRFPIVGIDSVLTGVPEGHQYTQRNIPDNVDELEIQPYRWTDNAKIIEPNILFSWRVQDAVYLPPGIHHESLDAGIKSIHPNAPARITEPVYIPLTDRGEAIISHEIASLVAKDGNAGNVHGWNEWLRWRGVFDALNGLSIAVCETSGTAQRAVWDALACGCLVMFNEEFSASEGQDSYPITAISPFTVFHSKDEMKDKLDWLTEHPDFLEHLRRDSEYLAVQYFTPAPLARRFLMHVHEAVK